MSSDTWVAFWRALLRWDKSKIHPLVAFRNTAVVVLTLIVSTLLGQRSLGLVVALGALNVAYSDGVDPYGIRARRMLLASAVCALAVGLGSVTAGHHTGAVAVAALWAFGAGMAVSLGQTAADIGTISTVTLLVFGARPLDLHHSLIAGLVALAGGLLQTAVALLFWPLSHAHQERDVLAGVYRELARLANQTVLPGAPPLATALFSNARQMLTGTGDHGPDAESYSSLMNQAERIRLRLLTLGRLRRRLERDAGSAESVEILKQFRAACARTLNAIADTVSTSSNAGHALDEVDSLDAFAGKLRGLCAPGASGFVAALHRESVLQMDAVAGQLRAALRHAARAENTWVVPGEVARPRRSPLTSCLARAVETLRANLNLGAVSFRHALRLAGCVALGDAIARSFEWQRTYWIPMTIAIVLKPDFMATFSRGALRLLGTLGGLIVATALFAVLPESSWTDVTLVGIFTLLLRWLGPANYGVLTFAVSAFVVALIASTGVPPKQVIALRGVNTVIGGTLAMLAYALWPTWERTQVGENMALLLDAYRDYLREVRRVYLQPEEADWENLDAKRNAARLARTNAEASADRLSAEPGVPAAVREKMPAMLASSHDFIYAAMTLEAGVVDELSSQPACVPLLHAFLDRVDLVLYLASSALRGDPTHLRAVTGLRESYRQLADCAARTGQHHALLLVETDRMTNALNTLREQALDIVKARKRPETPLPVETATG